MAPPGENPVIETNLRRARAAANNYTRQMKRRLKVKKGELQMWKTAKARLIASNEANEKLVTDFLEAENRKDFQQQEAMKDAISNSINPDIYNIVDDFLNGDLF